MGEYATRKSDGVEIKIGTCESMYYLRFEDRDKVEYPHSFLDCRFRLPFPDEDEVPIGEYVEHDRGIMLYKTEYKPSRFYEGAVESVMHPFEIDNAEEDPGLIQMHHDSGLLMNIKCYHGKKLPERTEEVGFHWNGKTPVNYQLKSIKYTKDGLKAVVGCRWCREQWRVEISDVLDYIPDEKLRNRIFFYQRM